MTAISPMPQPKSQLTTSVDPKIAQAVHKMAVRKRLTRASMVRKLIILGYNEQLRRDRLRVESTTDTQD